MLSSVTKLDGVHFTPKPSTPCDCSPKHWALLRGRVTCKSWLGSLVGHTGSSGCLARSLSPTTHADHRGGRRHSHARRRRALGVATASNPQTLH